MGSLDMLEMTEIMGSLDTLGMTRTIGWMSENKCDDCANGEKTRHMPIQHMPLFFCVYIGLFLCVPVFLEKEAGRLPSGTRSNFGSRAVHIKRFHLIIHMYTQIQRLA